MWKKNSSQNHFETKKGNKERSNLIQVTLNAALKKINGKENKLILTFT